MENMTALMCVFLKAYHYENNRFKIYSDSNAKQMLLDDEYNGIAKSLVNGISFFNPNFEGTEDEALKYIVNTSLAPLVLGRSAFCKKSFENSIKLGTEQYLAFGSGFDTFFYQQKYSAIKGFELDRVNVLDTKKTRLEKALINYQNISYIPSDFSNNKWINNLKKEGYHQNNISFSSMIGLTYYLTKEEFNKLLTAISSLVCEGSSIIFDYPTDKEGKEMNKTAMLAGAVNEEMKAKYNYQEIEKILENNGFLIYEHLNNEEMTNNYFSNYNILNPNNKIKAHEGVAYCLAVKKY